MSHTTDARPGRSVALLAVILGVAVACGASTSPVTTSPAATSSPAAPGSDGGARQAGPPGLDWATASVERPAGMDAAPPSISPVGNGGGLGHPGHFSGQGNPSDLARVGDQLLAVGYTFPGFHAVTWSSRDRHTWSLAELPPGGEDAFASAIADGLETGPTRGRAAIVGRIGNDAAAWSSAAGISWQPTTGGEAFVEAPATAMTTVVAGPPGFVSGGWAGISNQPGRPRFWASPDGRSWNRDVVIDTIGDGRVAAIARGADGFVAVGGTGPIGHATGSAVWTSPDGVIWKRAAVSPALAAGEMLSVAAGGPGYVAVGSNLTTTAAVVWLSADGQAWDLVPVQDSLTYHGLGITMADVTAGATGQLVAVGHFLFGSQYGQGTAWTSDDRGRTWTRMPDEAVFGQGEPMAVVPDGPGYVATGTVGAPDNYIPTVWLSPPDH